MKSKRIFSVIVAVTLAALFTNFVFADGGDPPSFIDISANGTVSIDTTELTFTGTYQAPPGNGNPGFNVSVRRSIFLLLFPLHKPLLLFVFHLHYMLLLYRLAGCPYILRLI